MFRYREINLAPLRKILMHITFNDKKRKLKIYCIQVDLYYLEYLNRNQVNMSFLAYACGRKKWIVENNKLFSLVGI